MTTTPRWLREHRRTAHAAAVPGWPAGATARRQGRLPRVHGEIDWEAFGETIPDEEWEPFIAAIEEVKGRPLVG